MEDQVDKLIPALWKILTSKGMGRLLKPWQDKREAVARLEVRRAEKLVLAQTEKDVEDILARRKQLEDFSFELPFKPVKQITGPKEFRIEPTINLPALAEVAVIQQHCDQMRREINVTKAILVAEECLQNDSQEPPDRKIDDDWLYRWRDYAGGVSAEKMQQLWGQLLAGEFKAPGSFSLRCLEFIRNLSQDEASLIQKAFRFAIRNDAVWSKAQDILESEGLGFGNMLELQYLGIIQGVESSDITSLQIEYRSTTSDCFRFGIISHNMVLIIEHADASKLLIIDVYVITPIGKELLRLGKFEPHIEYLIRFGEYLVAQGFTVSISSFTPLPDGKIKLINQVPIKGKQAKQTPKV